MKRIIIHWTGGINQPNSTEYRHYHYMINGDGLIIRGQYAPEDNENCSDGRYAAHTGGGNTGSIGVALCGMFGFTGKPESTMFPLKAVQLEAAYKKIAELCKKYKIPITPETVLTHYEFGKAHPKTTSAGKPDISYLHPNPQLKPDEIGNHIRNKVLWYYQRI